AERQSVRPRRHVAGLDELRRHNAEVMAPVIGALQTGQPLTIIGDGDSITAAHGGTAEADQLVPGGTTRDRADSYTIQTPAD
ncbi:hypothetical protein JI664_23740, partial [Rhodobacter sp. NTK016B]|uniref:hypothetical protein n=1 Tax=Rhodobacter sp. NTK016B TaxID=2759676 RepID=UPI001A9077B7